MVNCFRVGGHRRETADRDNGLHGIQDVGL